MRVILILLLICVPVSIHSQTPSPAPSPSAKHKTKVDTKYFADTNETAAQIGPLEILWPPSGGSAGLTVDRVDLWVYFTYPGKKIVTPSTVTLLVLSNIMGGKKQFEYDRNLSILTDSGNRNLGDLKVVSTTQRQVSTGQAYPLTMATLTTESARKEISFDDFARLAQAKTAQIKLADRKYKIPKETLEALRNFLMLMREQGREF
jgi:hypothetical protein